MAKRQVTKDTVSLISYIKAINSLLGNGEGLTGLTASSPGLTAYYMRPGMTVPASIPLVGGTLGSYASGAFIEVDDTKMPGIYEVHLPDAMFASGADEVIASFFGAANMVPADLEFELVDVDLYDSVSMGVSRIDADISSRAVPGDAMALVNDALGMTQLATSAVNEIRDAILSDSTPFAGANIDAAISSLATAVDLSALSDKVLRALGLLHENAYIDQATYDGNKLTGARVRIYDQAANVGSPSGVIATYDVEVTYIGDNMSTYKMTLL